MPRVADMTEAEKAAEREKWADAERRVRSKVRLPAGRVEPRIAVKPLFNQEHCEGCDTLLPRGNTFNVEVDGKWKFMCSRCKRPYIDEGSNR